MYAIIKSIILYDRFHQAWINGVASWAWPRFHNVYQTIVAPGARSQTNCIYVVLYERLYSRQVKLYTYSIYTYNWVSVLFYRYKYWIRILFVIVSKSFLSLKYYYLWVTNVLIILFMGIYNCLAPGPKLS